MRNLPGSVREIADVIGEDAALYLIDQLPKWSRSTNRHRTKSSTPTPILYVPKRLRPDHRLVSILGFEKAQQLVDGFGGETVKVANCNNARRAVRNDEIRRRAAEGERPADLARAFQLTERRIRGLTREMSQGGISAANDQ